MMWKKVFARMQVGFISTVLAVMLIQICIAQNGGSTVTERFASHFAAKDAAVLTQLLLVGGIGAAFSGASVVYDLERWSFLRQGIVYFVITAAVWVPVLLICWTPMPKEGILFSSLGPGLQPRLDGHLRDHVGDSVRGIPQADTRSEPEDS